MEKIEFEKELLAYLNLPSIPRKEWKEGDMPFEKGVAVIEYYGERLAYAVCKFDPNSGIKRPRVIKTFGTEPFIKIVKVFVVPNYMSNIEDVKDMDLDEQSKKKAEQMLKEAQELAQDELLGFKISGSNWQKMSEKQKEALSRIEAALQKIPRNKQEYLLGYADAMDDMNQQAADPQEEKSDTNKS